MIKQGSHPSDARHKCAAHEHDMKRILYRMITRELARRKDQLRHCGNEHDLEVSETKREGEWKLVKVRNEVSALEVQLYVVTLDGPKQAAARIRELDYLKKRKSEELWLAENKVRALLEKKGESRRVLGPSFRIATRHGQSWKEVDEARASALLFKEK